MPAPSAFAALAERVGATAESNLGLALRCKNDPDPRKSVRLGAAACTQLGGCVAQLWVYCVHKHSPGDAGSSGGGGGTSRRLPCTLPVAMCPICLCLCPSFLIRVNLTVGMYRGEVSRAGWVAAAHVAAVCMRLKGAVRTQRRF